MQNFFIKRVYQFALMLCLGLFFSSCSWTPEVYYIGESFARNEQVDIFYDEQDIKQEYSTMGRLAHDDFNRRDIQIIADAMIEKAKATGADGIVFLDAIMEEDPDGPGGKLNIRAKLIQYN